METDAATVAALIGAVVGLVKVLDKVVDFVGSWIKQKTTPPAQADAKTAVVVVQLDAEVSRMIRDTHDKVFLMHNVVGEKDFDGVPLVYSSRSVGENVVAVAAAVRDVSSSQERIVDVLKDMDDKIDENGDKLTRALTSIEDLKR